MRYVEKALIGMQDRLEKIYLKEITRYKWKYLTDGKYYSLNSYLDYFGTSLPPRLTGILGIRLTRVCRATGTLIFKEKTQREGYQTEVSTYPTFMMRRVMTESFLDPDVWTEENFIEMDIEAFTVKFFENNQGIIALNRNLLKCMPLKKFRSDSKKLNYS